jgi:hypothetical protein
MVLRLLLAVYCTYLALNLDEERQESRNILFDILVFLFLALDLDGKRQESRNILLFFWFFIP